MKTNILKTVLPFFALLLAVGLSFAVEAKRVNQIGYFEDPVFGLQSIETDCEKQENGNLCKTAEGYQLYATEQLDQVENNELRRDQQ